MPQSQPKKKIDVVIPLPKELQDMGYKELRIMDQNGIVVTVDDTRFLFVYDERNYAKSIERLQDALLNRKVDERIATIVTSGITNLILTPEVQKLLANGNAANANAAAIAKSTASQETQLILEEVNVLIEKYKDLPYEVWREELVKRCQRLRQVVKDNIPQSWEALECVMTSKGILHIKDISLPLLLIIVGNPSTWKTVGISMLRRWPNTYYIDDFNPASFVSHASVEDEQQLEAIDMIRDMKDRLTMIPELAPLFMKHEEKLSDSLKNIVRLADGEGLQTHSGLHGLRGVDEPLMFSLVGATVEVPNRVYKVLSSLGPKLYFFRTKFEQATKQQLKSNLQGLIYELKVRNIKDALFDYLKWLEVCPLMVDLVNIPSKDTGIDADNNNTTTTVVPARRRVIEWNQSKDEPEAIEMLADLALLLAKIRTNTYAYEAKSKDARLTAVGGEDSDTQQQQDIDGEFTSGVSYEYTFEQPIEEHASRASVVLYNIAKAHAFELHGRNYITLAEDLPIVVKITLSSANRNRVSVLRHMITAMRNADQGGQLEHKEKFFAKDLTSALKFSPTTARRIMKELEVIGLVSIGKEAISGTTRNYSYYIKLVSDFHWLIEDRFQNIMKDFDWDTFDTAGEVTEEPASVKKEPMHRLYGDRWACDLCGWKDDIHGVRNHIPHCDKNPGKHQDIQT
jgi:Mn-dependent DtxR family transcriptional regulator